MTEIVIAILAFVFLRNKLTVAVSSGNGGSGSTVTSGGGGSSVVTGGGGGGNGTAFNNSGNNSQFNTPENIAINANNYPLGGYFLIKFVTRAGINPGGTQQASPRTTSGVEDYLAALANPATNGNSDPALLGLTFVDGSGERDVRNNFDTHGLVFV